MPIYKSIGSLSLSRVAKGVNNQINWKKKQHYRGNIRNNSYREKQIQYSVRVSCFVVDRLSGAALKEKSIAHLSEIIFLITPVLTRVIYNSKDSGMKRRYQEGSERTTTEPTTWQRKLWHVYLLKTLNSPTLQNGVNNKCLLDTNDPQRQVPPLLQDIISRPFVS